MVKRLFDVVVSLLGLIILTPILLLIAILIKLDSKGPVLFIQPRVGLHNKDFNIFKFRTMVVESDKKGLLTIGNNDSRITRIGYFLRRYKIDEFPQLINILIGNMSFVGPRPELRQYVNYYHEDDMVVFSVRPGITGLASIAFRNEVELLKNAEDPEQYFIHSIIPEKLKLNKAYIKKRDFFFDLKLIAITVVRVLTK
ncbi:glycosyl transferase [Yeosuana aromativorans]|uniref:Glycosyl transferase n=1 Tax=Yeosuana aromativorans TaxID=288019 RepID=A0A8J3BQN6_9FLAO|nr:sugar transferase [Yeosuana aromativorans]GGK29163.1 glycosyl transferase [Yeosuana aromativorans]